jgi:hypothetical protein
MKNGKIINPIHDAGFEPASYGGELRSSTSIVLLPRNN